MERWIKAAAVGAVTALVGRFATQHLIAQGWSEETTTAAIGAANLIVFVAVSRGLGDTDLNPASPA